MQSPFRLALTLAALFAPGLAMAETSEVLQRDPNCVKAALVLYGKCKVDVIYTCPAPDGIAEPSIRHESFNKSELDGVTEYTSDGRIISIDAPKARLHLEGALGRSVGTGVAQLLSQKTGVRRDILILRVGKLSNEIYLTTDMTLTGASVMLGQTEAQVVESRVETFLPPPQGRTTTISHDYVLPAQGLYIYGEDISGNAEASSLRPTSVILPGEPGFDQPHPTHDCGNLSYNHLDKKADQA